MINVDVSENSKIQEKIVIHQAACIGKDQYIAHLLMNSDFCIHELNAVFG